MVDFNLQKEIKCPECKEEFGSLSILTAHYRHKHTAYEETIKQIAIELKQSKGLTASQRYLMARNEARQIFYPLVEEKLKQKRR